MYFLNKIVGGCTSPLLLGLVMLCVGFALGCIRKYKVSLWLMGLALAWLWLWGTPVMTVLLGVTLEKGYLDGKGRMRSAEVYPVCDAIVDLCGGVGTYPGFSPYPELFDGADRPYFCAKLWQAGRAPVIIPSSANVEDSDVRFLTDLGVPATNIVEEAKARNTEENAQFVSELLLKRNGNTGKRPRVLLVTSAWHMKRSELMFRKYAPGIDVVAAPCDFSAMEKMHDGIGWDCILPTAGTFSWNYVFLHEWIGYWGYRLFR